MQNMPASYVERKPKGMPCFAKGCVVLAVLAGIFVVLCWIGGLYYQHHFGEFLSENQVSLRANDTTNEQYQAAMRKLQPLFGMETSPQLAPLPISITADDLNALVAHDRRFADAKNKCYFTIPGNELAVDVSAEIPNNGNSLKKPQYFNARLIGDLVIAGGTVRLTPHKIESLNGQQIPNWALNNGISQSLLETYNTSINTDIRNNTDLADAVAKIESSKIADGHLVLTLRPSGGEPAGGVSPVASPHARE